MRGSQKLHIWTENLLRGSAFFSGSSLILSVPIWERPSFFRLPLDKRQVNARHQAARQVEDSPLSFLGADGLV